MSACPGDESCAHRHSQTRSRPHPRCCADPSSHQREGANRDMNPGGGGGRGATRPLSAMPQRERPASAHNVMFGRPGVESDRPPSGSGAAPHMKRDTLADASRRAYTLRPGGAGSARAGLNRPASALSVCLGQCFSAVPTASPSLACQYRWW